MKIRNLVKGLLYQGPPKRFFRNFFITGNALGLFSKRSHLNFNGKPKVKYNTLKSANRAAEKMSNKLNTHFSVYKCIFCDGYHIGKNRDNK